MAIYAARNQDSENRDTIFGKVCGLQVAYVDDFNARWGKNTAEECNKRSLEHLAEDPDWNTPWEKDRNVGW